MIKIIVDSTTDLPKNYFEKHQIKIVPLIVNIKQQSYKDKVELEIDDVYQALRDGEDVKTSQPNPQDIYDAITEEVKNGHDVLFITISQKLSGTFQTIHMIAEEIKVEYPDRKITIIDSKGGSAIPGLIALQAVELIEDNTPYDDIIKVLNHMADHCEHIFTVQDLKYLFKSGRLGRATALIGNLLHVKPILHVDDGEIKLLKKVRGKNKALSTIIDLVEEKMENYQDQPVVIMYAGEKEVAEDVEQRLYERLRKKAIFIDQIGSALGTHIGIGGVGVFFFNEKPPIKE